MKVNNNHLDYDLLNDQLDNSIRKIIEVIRYKKEKGEQISLSKMNDNRDFKLYSSFYDFMKDEIEKSILKEFTKKVHRRTLSVMKEFKKELSTVEPFFETLTQFMGLGKVNTIGLEQANKCMHLSAMAYNLKKYLKFIQKRTKSGSQISPIFKSEQKNKAAWSGLY